MFHNFASLESVHVNRAPTWTIDLTIAVALGAALAPLCNKLTLIPLPQPEDNPDERHHKSNANIFWLASYW